MKKFNTYTAYTTDEYCLPVCQTDTALELANWLDVSVTYLYFCIRYRVNCNGFEVRADAFVD